MSKIKTPCFLFLILAILNRFPNEILSSFKYFVSQRKMNPLLQCVLFGTFMIWFASITINLGPTFLSGALAASAGSYGSYGPAPSCPLVRGPFRHYVLNALWIGVNAVCIGLTLFHLKKLHRDLTKVCMSLITLHSANTLGTL